MIELKKEVRRKVGDYVVVLCPPVRDEPAILKIRERKRRHWYEVTFASILWMGARKEAERVQKEKALNRELKRAARK